MKEEEMYLEQNHRQMIEQALDLIQEADDLITYVMGGCQDGEKLLKQKSDLCAVRMKIAEKTGFIDEI